MMKFSKLVSGISSLAIASSMFAGLAVTASADSTKADTIGSWTICNPADRVVATATSVEATDTEIAYTNVSVTGSTDYAGVYHGNAHIGSGTGSSTDATTRTAGTRTATQKIKFTSDSGSNLAEYIGNAIKSGGGNFRGLNAVASWTYSGSGAIKLTAGSTSKEATLTLDTWYDLKVVAEYGTSSATVTATLTADGATEAAVTATGTLEEGKTYDIDTFTVSTVNKTADTSYFYSASEGISTTAPAATKLTVKYQDEDGNDLQTAAEIDLSEKDVSVGDSYTYSIPKYIIKNGTLYLADSKTYAPSVSLDAVVDEVTATYKAQTTGTPYFVEHESISGNSSALDSGNFSGNSATRAINAGVSAFTVTEAGMYDITVVAACRNVDYSSTFAVYKNSVSTDNLLFSGDAKGYSQNGPYSVTENVQLAANDVVIIQGDNGNTWIDYVLAIRTGDAPPTVEAENLGGFTGTDGDTATAFTATLTGSDTSSTITEIAVTSGGETSIKTAGKDFTSPTLSNADAVIGIIVSGIADDSAAATVTFK